MKAPRNYVIWSINDHQWWRERDKGYTPDFQDAGRYTREEAISYARLVGDVWGGSRPPSNVAIPLEDALLLVEHPLDRSEDAEAAVTRTLNDLRENVNSLKIACSPSANDGSVCPHNQALEKVLALIEKMRSEKETAS